MARKSREDYIEYIGGLSRKYSSEFWWLTSLSEKNPYISKVFLRSCYVQVAQQLVQDHTNNTAILLIVQDRAVRRCLCNHLGDGRQLNTRWYEPIGWGFANWFTEIIQLFLRRIWSVLKNVARIVIARAVVVHSQIPFARLDQPRPTELVLLHSWIDQRSFNDYGTYQSINFGNLHEYLASQGRRCMIVPCILPTLSFRSGLRSLVRSGIPFLLPQFYLTPLDVIRVAFLGFKRPGPREYPSFKGIDISGLILDDQRQDWMMARYPVNALLITAVGRWKKADIDIQAFIYSFENHIWEKAFCLAFRRHYPNTTLIGYQDASLPKMLLNYFVAKKERPILPFPDIVITNGRHSYELLARSGYEPTQLRCGGALRYQYLADLTQKRWSSKAGSPGGLGTRAVFVLVTSSLAETPARELILKTIQALGRDSRIRIVVKCHPGLPFSVLSKDLGDQELPPHLKVADRPVSELLHDADILLYTDSTTSLEGLAAGIPLVHVSSDLALDLDPLDGFPEVRKTVCEPEQLLQAVLATIDSSHDLVERLECRSELATRFFGPTNGAFYKYFLGLSEEFGPSTNCQNSLN